MRRVFGSKKMTGGRRIRSGGGDMAHRRSLTAGRLAVGLGGGLTAALLMAGAVFLSNNVTGLRSDIASLKNYKCCLQASNAQLQADWNTATAADVIQARAADAGFRFPAEPPLVLVRADRPDRDRGRAWRQLLDHLGGGAEAVATEMPVHAASPGLVSLVPRAARGQGR